jgi:hypothetical protein
LPLSPDFRNLKDANGDFVYRGPAWKARRARLLDRCGHKCERCRVPHLTTVQRGKGGSWAVGEFWFSWDGTPRHMWERVRTVRIILTMAHLTHDPLRNDDADLAMLCQWCHLNYDKMQHRETRCNRKDAARPLLLVADSVSLSEIVRRFGEQFEAAAQGGLHGSL